MYTLCALNYIVLNTLSLLLIICLRFMVDIFAGSGQCYQVFESVIQMKWIKFYLFQRDVFCGMVCFVLQNIFLNTHSNGIV